MNHRRDAEAQRFLRLCVSAVVSTFTPHRSSCILSPTPDPRTPLMPDKPSDETAAYAALAEFKDPETGRPITQLEQVHQLRLEDDRLSVVLGLTTWAAPLWTRVQTELAEHLRRRLPHLTVGVEVVAHAGKPEKLGEIGLAAKTVLAVGSGKGGVGKSSVAAYLACGLRRAGCQVGLMDADVYGPSIPHLFGTA